MEYSIGRELVKLIHTENQISILNDFYHDYLFNATPIEDVIKNDIYEDNIRYMSVQHLANFDELIMSDLEDRYLLGINIRIVKREKIFEVLRNKNQFIKRVRNKAKENIFDIVRKAKNNGNQFSGMVYHYFLGSQYMINFSITLDIGRNQLLIDDVYCTENNTRIEDPSNNCKLLIGQEL